MAGYKNFKGLYLTDERRDNGQLVTAVNIGIYMLCYEQYQEKTCFLHM